MNIYNKIFEWVNKKITYSLMKQTTDPVIWNLALRRYKQNKRCNLLEDWKNDKLEEILKND